MYINAYYYYSQNPYVAWPMDCYGAYTTESNVEQALEYQVEGYYNYVTNWWVETTT